MKLLYLSPPDHLTPFVDHYFIYDLNRGEVAQVLPDGGRILPCTYGRMGIFFGKPTVKRIEGKVASVNPPIGISGFYTQPRNYTSPHGICMFIVGFTPLGLQQLLDFPLSEITNQNIDARYLFAEHDHLLNELYAAPDWPARVRVINQFLTLKFARVTPDRRAWNVINCILASKGKMSVQETAAELSVSERTLRRIMSRHVGITPKTFSTLVRFQSAAVKLAHTRPASLTDLAHATGYYDQAHFIHEFGQFFGDTPGTFIQLERSFLGRFVDQQQQHTGSFTGIAYI